MKLAFSTLGCPKWSFQEIYATAKDLGFWGIELRGIGDEIYVPKLPIFAFDKIDETLSKLKSLRLEIPCVTSSAVLSVKERADASYKEACDYIDIAHKIGAPYVRVMCTDMPSPSEADYDLTIKAYTKVCEYARFKNVTPLIETNGIFCDTALLRRFMTEVDMPNSGVLWDIHHPFRYNGESAATTINNIGKYVKHIHVKDSKLVGGVNKYCLLGQGNIPVEDVVKLMNEQGYDGFYSLEWTKRWNTELEDAGIVFAHYVNYMKALEE